MRAGTLDHVILVERATPSIDGNGVAQEAWATLATMRAQVIQTSTDEYIRGAGAISDAVIVFRTRFIDGVTLADRVNYGGKPFNIKQLKEIGRRNGLEIRCERIGP